MAAGAQGAGRYRQEHAGAGYGRAEQIAHEVGARFAVVECTCADEATWRERIEGRKALALPAHHQTNWTVFRMLDSLVVVPEPAREQS